MLSSCYRAWLGLNPEDKTSLNILNEEMARLVQCGAYGHLLTTRPRLAADLVVLPVLYADVESSDDSANFLLIDVVEKCCRGINEKEKSAFKLVISAYVVAQLITAPRDDCRLTAAQVLGCIGRRGTDFFVPYLYSCERYLVDGYPRVLYHVLMADSMQAAIGSNVRAIVGGRLHRLLEHAARALGKEVHKAVVDTEGGTILGQGPLRELMMALVWDLGAEEAKTSSAAASALAVLCFLHEHRSWRVAVPAGSGAGPEEEKQLKDDMRDCTATLLSVHFLYMMSFLLQSDQHEQFLSQQVRCLRCIREVSGLLRHTDLAKFLPKVRRNWCSIWLTVVYRLSVVVARFSSRSTSL